MSFEDSLRIRPLMSKSEVFTIPTDDIHIEFRKLRNFRWGHSSESNLDGVDRREILEEIEFSFDPLQPYEFKRPFFSTVDLYGFVLGSLLKECKSKMEKEGFQQIRHVKRFRSFLRTAQNTFELKLSFFLQDDGTEILYGINIGQENLSKIREERKSIIEENRRKRKQASKKANEWKFIRDEDEMLLDWAKHCKPWDDYSESQFMAYANWLIRSNPIERHIAAKAWNWDYSVAPPIWISRQPDTDIATAISIFFQFEPSYYLKHAGDLDAAESPHHRFILRNVLEIKRKIETGFYTNSNIYADFWAEIGDDKTYLSQFPEIGHTYPINIRQKYKGIDPYDSGIIIPTFGIY